MYSEVTSSQPVGLREAGEGVDSAEAVISFTQPSRYDELIIGTQIPCTPGASQVCVVSVILHTHSTLHTHTHPHPHTHPHTLHTHTHTHSTH